MPKRKEPKGKRPVPEYQEGPEAAKRFLDAMKALVRPTEKKSPKPH